MVSVKPDAEKQFHPIISNYGNKHKARIISYKMKNENEAFEINEQSICLLSYSPQLLTQILVSSHVWI